MFYNFLCKCLAHFLLNLFLCFMYSDAIDLFYNCLLLECKYIFAQLY